MNLEGPGPIYNNKSICKGFAKKHVCMGECRHPNVPLHLSDCVDQECMGCRGEEDPVDLDRPRLRPVTAIGIRGETMHIKDN